MTTRPCLLQSPQGILYKFGILPIVNKLPFNIQQLYHLSIKTEIDSVSLQSGKLASSLRYVVGSKRQNRILQIYVKSLTPRNYSKWPRLAMSLLKDKCHIKGQLCKSENKASIAISCFSVTGVTPG